MIISEDILKRIERNTRYPSSARDGLYAFLDSGKKIGLASTSEGHLEVAVHGPRLPFGSLHTERLYPVFQSDGVYGISSWSMITSTGLAVGVGAGSGQVTSSGNRLVASTGTTALSFASLQSRKRLRYRAGQGVVGRFAGFFESPVNNSILVAGFGTSESTIAFGYNSGVFGILYSTGGVREIHTFTVTVASTATNNYNVTLPNGQVVNVPATNNASTTQTAYEISLGTFPGWTAEARGNTVIFLANSGGNKSGSFSLDQTGAGVKAAGTDAETVAGAASNDVWIPQTQWNGDRLDGSGDDRNPSGFNINPLKFNIYQIGVQYLGAGPITFQVEVTYPNGNNPEFVTVHTIKYPNTETIVSLSQPAFPFLMAAYSAGSTTDAKVHVSSFAGFNEGEILHLGPRVSYDRDGSVITSSTTVYKPLLTVRNDLVFAGRANQTVIKLIDMAASAKGNANAQTKFYLVRNPVLSGPVNFTAVGGGSSAYWDIAATGMTAPSQSQKIWSGSVVESSNIDHSFVDTDITLQPGESICLCVKSVSATADCVGTLNTREDQ